MSPPPTGLDAIREALQDVCLDAIDGSAPGPMLYRRIRRLVEARLRRFVGRDFTGFVVEVGPGAVPEEVVVEVRVQTPRRVESLRLNMSAI